jgi:hypothetical protein
MPAKSISAIALQMTPKRGAVAGLSPMIYHAHGATRNGAPQPSNVQPSGGRQSTRCKRQMAAQLQSAQANQEAEPQPDEMAAMFEAAQRVLLRGTHGD